MIIDKIITHFVQLNDSTALQLLLKTVTGIGSLSVLRHHV